MKKNNNFVWIDLEMTGLDPQKDSILEIATIITDDQLQIIEEREALVLSCSAEKLQSMEPFVFDMHQKSGLMKRVQESVLTVTDAQKQVLTFIEKHCEFRMALLAGNSVWQDRMFLFYYMPDILSYLHYRLVDVTTIKELVARWYPHDKERIFKKNDTHRALSDIRESIEELRHLKKKFFIAV